ncbi:MAG: peptidylprolyl isomerase [Oscillospiraceae bacterium]
MKKYIALALCLCLVLALCAGCGGSEIVAYEENEPEAEELSADTEEAVETEAPAGIDLGGSGFNTHPAETVVGTVNGREVTWMEYFYWLNYYTDYVQQFAAQYGVVLDGWAANDLSSTETNAQVVIANAQRDTIQDQAIQAEMALRGVTLSEEDEATLQSVIEQNADSVTGDGDGTATEEEIAAFEVYLQDELNVDRAFFEEMNVISLLADEGFIDEYGMDGEKMSDEDVLAFAEENGMMAAKHILITTVDTTTMEALSDEEIAEKHQRAEDLLAQLQAETDPAAQEALFDELCAEYTEDTGYAYYPDGYVFVEGQMVTEFEDAVEAMEVGQLSGLVESDYGYHIIMRIPVEPDAVIGTTSSGEESTLRFVAAYQTYLNEMQSWIDEAEVVWYEGFEEPDMAAIFG